MPARFKQDPFPSKPIRGQMDVYDVLDDMGVPRDHPGPGLDERVKAVVASKLSKGDTDEGRTEGTDPRE